MKPVPHSDSPTEVRRSIQRLQFSGDTSTVDIAANAAGIAVNVIDIATNAADIATNVTDIASIVAGDYVGSTYSAEAAEDITSGYPVYMLDGVQTVGIARCDTPAKSTVKGIAIEDATAGDQVKYTTANRLELADWPVDGEAPAEDDVAETFGNVVGGDKWNSGAIAANGYIYGCPEDNANIAKIDTAADTIATFAGPVGNFKYDGCAVAANNMIYCVPRNAGNVLKIDPSDDSYSTIGVIVGTNRYRGAVLAADGCIYGIPYSATKVLKIDPTTDTVSEVGGVAGVTYKWASGALDTVSGCIYCPPYDNVTTVLKFDPSDNSSSVFGNIAGTDKYIGAVLADNGCIYGIPYTATAICKIDPSDNSVTTFGDIAGAAKYAHGFLSNNGKIYCIPYTATQVMVIDPSDDSIAYIDTALGAGAKWYGGAMNDDNTVIYGMPYDSTAVLKITPYVAAGPAIVPLIPGTRYYLASTGGLTTTKTVVAGHVVVSLGWAVDDATLDVSIFETLMI